MLRQKLLATAAISPLLFTPASAQDVFALDEIIVSGGLSPIEADALGRSSSVVTSREIEDRGITTVQDALKALPGVSVNGTGNSSIQVRIRGGESNHTLVLIDGIEAAGGDSEYFFSGLEAANIERIEVLRGPQSVYYGSNASSGVINIITKKGSEGSQFSTSLEVGEATTATAFVSRRNDRGGVALSLSHLNDRGFDQSGDGGEKDGLERDTLILTGDYLVTDMLKLGFILRRSNEDYEYDSLSFSATDADSYVIDDSSLYSTRDETAVGLYAEYEMLDGRLTHRLSYQKTEYKSSFNGGASTTADTEALKYRLSFGLDGQSVSAANHLLSLLVERQEDGSTSNPSFGRTANSVALEYRGSFGKGLDLQLGARFDNNSEFEDATTWNAGLSYQIPDTGVRLHASAGTGVVNPTYFELFADSFGFSGNADLNPERNKSFDIGAEFQIFEGRGLIDVTYFRETLTDEITDVSTGPGTFSFINQSGDSDREGIEVSGYLQATDTLSVRLAYTYLDAKNPNGSVEVRRPRHELALGATLDTFGGRGSVAADIRHVSGNFDTQFWGSFATVELPSYTTVDLAARYELTDTLTLNGRVTNLFDKDTSDVWGFAGRGRAAYVGISANF